MYYKNILMLLCIHISFSNAIEMSQKQLESTAHCKKDADCLENSFCSENTLERPGFCVCNDGYIIQKGEPGKYECLKKASYGERCTEDIQCQIDMGIRAICINNQCSCEQGSHVFLSRCYQTVKLGGHCEYEQSCLLTSQRAALCLLGVCSCPRGEGAVHYPNGEEDCLPGSNLGEGCTATKPCLVKNSTCHLAICRCLDKYTSSSDDRRCLWKAQHLGDTCEEGVQCEDLPESQCFNQTCQCPKGLSATGNNRACRRPRRKGLECTIDPDCGYLEHCNQGICDCEYAYDKEKNECVNSGHIYLSNAIVILVAFILSKIC